MKPVNLEREIRSLEEIEMRGKNFLKTLAAVTFVSFIALACGQQEETPAPGMDGADTTMTEPMPDTTTIAPPDTVGNM